MAIAIKLICNGSGSSGNSYALIDNDGGIFLIELGVPEKIIKQSIDFRVSDIQGAFVGHCHRDHALSIDKFRNMGIPIFAPYIDKKMTGQYVRYKVQAFPLVHDVETYGLYLTHPEIGSLIYVSDTEYVPQIFAKQKVSTIICECNYQKKYVSDDEVKRNRVYQTHMELETFKDFIKTNATDRLRAVIACHLSTSSADGEEILGELDRIVPDGVRTAIAVKGLSIEL